MVDVEHALRSVLANEAGDIVAAYLFGSQARGTARPDSDVDVAILFAKPPPRSLAGLHLDLAGKLSRQVDREVDLVVLNDAPVDLAHRVLREGKLLLDVNRARRIAHEVKVRNEYFDLLPYLEMYRGIARTHS